MSIISVFVCFEFPNNKISNLFGKNVNNPPCFLFFSGLMRKKIMCWRKNKTQDQTPGLKYKVHQLWNFLGEVIPNQSYLSSFDQSIKWMTSESNVSWVFSALESGNFFPSRFANFSPRTLSVLQFYLEASHNSRREHRIRLTAPLSI